jgi:hypothetical protein
MKKVSEYLSHVEECRTLARRARSPQDRDVLLNMAATWERSPRLARRNEQESVRQGITPCLALIGQITRLHRLLRMSSYALAAASECGS